MPVTFNSNNNYSVDIITELDVDNPSVFQYSSQTNTPFVTVKITPTNPQTNPVLASNLKFDEQVPDFAWNGSTQQPPACEPPPPPHGTNSSLLHTTGISIPNSCVSQGFTSFFGESNAPQQGPYLLQNSVANRDAQILAFGVGYFEILLVEVYEDDSGNLVNVDFSPATDEQYNHWSMWESPARTGTSGPSITNNVYPVYVKAFIMLQFGTNGLFSNTILNIDIDEVEPIYGCTDPISLDYNSNATIDDGSCMFPTQSYTIQFSDSGIDSTGPYTSNFNTYRSWYGTFTRNFVFNGNGNPLVLGNTYSPGDIVNELVTIELTPQSHPTIVDKELVYDFPIPGGPNPNITQTPGYTNQGDQWGDAKNNLTGTSIRILNMNDQTVTYADAGPFSQWHNSVDPTGFRPRYVTEFGLNPGDGTYTSHIITTDPNGNDLHIPTAGTDPLSTFGGVGTVEWYYFDSNPQLNENPGYEWFPYKIWLSINIKDFVMPAHNVDVVLQIDHNTENQGDPDWVAPGTIYGCTDPNATNFYPGANVDDGSCLYTDDDGEGGDDPLVDA
tara:strand:+ start:916 stop:2583 length:1668 start_codon:yes stop_codon:yes gene_type:complete